MKKKISLFSVLALLLCGSFLSATPAFADYWVPASGTGNHVKIVEMDMRSSITPAGYARIQVIFSEASTTSYFYYFDASSATQFSKANAIYATLLTAKSTGELVNVLMDGNTGYIVAAQLGSN
jgi:hypothetical protein